MRWPLLVADSARTLGRFKGRTVLMGIGVALGVAILVAGRSFGDGAERQFLDRVDRMFGPGTILVISPTLTVEDLEAIGARLPQIIAWSPRFGLGTREIGLAGGRRQVAVYGHAANGDEVWNRGVVAGRYLSSADLAATARVALIGPKLAGALFAGDDPVGRQITLGGDPFEVVGVLEPIGIDPHGEDRDEDVFVPLTTAMRRLANTDVVGWAKLVVENLERVDDEADEVAAVLREAHRLAPDEKDDFRLFSSKLAGRSVAKAKRTLSRYLFLVAGVVLLVAGAVIASIMLAVVRERVSEIGLRKAVGATEGQIAAQLVIEAAIVSLGFGVAGAGLGLLAARVVASRMQLSPELDAGSLVLGLAIAVTVGVVAALLPARGAARLDPVAALR